MVSLEGPTDIELPSCLAKGSANRPQSARELSLRLVQVDGASAWTQDREREWWASHHSLPPLDLVLLSHNHYDHLDRPAVQRIARAHPDATWVVPLGLDRYIRRWGPRHIVELDWWGETRVPGGRITAIPARHFSARGPGDRNRSLWCGFSVEAGDRRVFFAGDTAYHPDFSEVGARLGPFDLAQIPIGAYDPRWFMRVVHADPRRRCRSTAT